MTLLAQSVAASDPTFIPVVKMAATAAAIAIIGENQPSFSSSHKNKRAQLAILVLNSPSQIIERFTTALASQGLSAASTDVAINSGVSSVWDAIAGVTFNE